MTFDNPGRIDVLVESVETPQPDVEKRDSKNLAVLTSSRPLPKARTMTMAWSLPRKTPGVSVVGSGATAEGQVNYKIPYVWVGLPT